jgi:DNA helicase HerA-like ATPase
MKLVKILSDSVQIRTNQSEFNDVRINDLLSVYDKSVNLVAMVTGLTDTDTSAPIGDNDFIGEVTGLKTIECSIIGSIKDNRFVKAIDFYPTTNVQISKIDSSDFSTMLTTKINECFNIGKFVAYDFHALVNGNKFFQRHACIVGNTGSGKSETVAKILEESAKLPGSNIVVFDIHGEYSKMSYVSNIKIGDDFPFPIWMFGFNDIINNILRIKEETATTVMTALRKCYYSVCENGRENKPMYFDYSKLIEEMECLDNQDVATGEFYKTGDKAGMAKTNKGEYNGKLTSTINILRDRISDSRYSFLFVEKFQSYLFDVVNAIMGSNKPVKNIDLSNVPHDVALPIIGVITRIIFDIQRMQDINNIHPVTIVCDEAHVYIPNNFQLSASQRRMVEIFEDIAKEGRKFGITLLPATQRPSELNKTIVAQCSNFIVSKLNNENDKSMIKGMLPDGDDKIIDSVTMFNPGEVLIIGDAVQIPLKIKVELANERPLSRTIDFWNLWSGESNLNINDLVDKYLS